ncbi:MAG TPA: ETC complex I subunit [Rhodopila sp.]|uniref:ETC complex I subunit n=1 Tax=Rhodopila sp. TaxID=2480087 RepID=UPI002CDB8BBE|nr:ETC complex I subunit [Rhodopila sp.]HVY17568.1 ETC complex I subunit [Rhodopila sp.]
MRARIFQPPKTAMQSGWAKTHLWTLEYVNSTARRPDPLMGWTGGGDTQAQVKLTFETKEEAIAFAERNGLQYEVELPQARRVKPKAYADNFKYDRVENWTH